MLVEGKAAPAFAKKLLRHYTRDSSGVRLCLRGNITHRDQAGSAKRFPAIFDHKQIRRRKRCALRRVDDSSPSNKLFAFRGSQQLHRVVHGHVYPAVRQQGSGCRSPGKIDEGPEKPTLEITVMLGQFLSRRLLDFDISRLERIKAEPY
ncbi:hypothetical protein D9M68_610660 [compost metagenome]